MAVSAITEGCHVVRKSRVMDGTNKQATVESFRLPVLRLAQSDTCDQNIQVNTHVKRQPDGPAREKTERQRYHSYLISHRED